MQSRLVLVCLFLVGAVALNGCKPKEDGGTATGVTEQTRAVAMVLCGTCGHEKGSAACCSDDCEICAVCQLHKDSVLCCKVPEDARGKDMCAGCGHVADGENCCKDGCEVCILCGMHKGSLLCCKLTGTANAPAAPAGQQPAAQTSDTVGEDDAPGS